MGGDNKPFYWVKMKTLLLAFLLVLVSSFLTGLVKAEREDEEENDLENTIEDFDNEEDQAMGIPDEEEEDSDDEGEDEDARTGSFRRRRISIRRSGMYYQRRRRSVTHRPSRRRWAWKK